MTYLKPSAIRRTIRDGGKRCGADFLQALDRYVDTLLTRALTTHNGSKKTVDASVLAYLTGQLR
jgi:hypothetical protein